MVPALRKAYNEAYTNEKYHSFLSELDTFYPSTIQFRLAETPLFIPKTFTQQMLSACDSIIDIITDPKFISITDKSIPPADKVPGNYGFPQMLVFDFGICNNATGDLEPQLIEMQGFPSLYAFQAFYPEILRKHFTIPEHYHQYLGNHNRETYLQLLNEVLLGPHNPEHVVLLEIKPHEQKTRIDFYCTRDITGIQPICLSELIQQGTELFYLNNGKKTKIKRIYNRVIFDELNTRTDTDNFIDIRQPWDVEWIPHPDWFYRISKYTLPYIIHPYVPETFFLHEVKQLPSDLENFVLKPLFSFAGQGVIIDINESDIEKITDPENWILQRKVEYADIIPTPSGPAKAEIRIMYLWKEGAARPEPVINLARLSKGKMIGTRYNKDKDWVGGSVAFFEH